MLVDKKIKPTKQQLFNEEQKKLLKNRKVVQLNTFIKGDVSAFSVNDLKIFRIKYFLIYKSFCCKKFIPFL